MSRSFIAGAMLLLPLSLAYAGEDTAAQAPPALPSPPNMQEPAVGDHWSYQITDEISGKLKETREVLVTDLSKNDITTRFDVTGTGRSGTIVYDRSWNILSDGSLRYTPNDGTGVHLPLTLDNKWTFATNSQNSSNGATFKRTGSARVVGKETVTTKAGAFDTFVVETKFTSRNNKTPSRFSEISLKTWFSPELDHWVKRSDTVREGGHLVRSETVELLEFGRKK